MSFAAVATSNIGSTSISPLLSYKVTIEGPSRLGVGETSRYVAIVTNLKAQSGPNSIMPGDFIWSSSNPKVASFSGGYIKAKSEGTTKITVKYKNAYSSMYLAVIDKSTIKFAKTSITMTEGTKAQIPFSTSGVIGTAKITWSSSNTKVATVSQTGVVNAISAGTATITATINGNHKAACKVTVTPKKLTISDIKVSFSKGGVTFAQFIGNKAIVAQTPPVADGNTKDVITVKISLHKSDKLKEVKYKWNNQSYKTISASSVIDLRVPKNTLSKNTLTVYVKTASGLKLEPKVTINTPKGVEKLTASFYANDKLFAKFDNKGSNIIVNSGPFVKTGTNIKLTVDSNVSKVKEVSYEWLNTNKVTNSAVGKAKATINIPCPTWKTSESYKDLKVTVTSVTGNSFNKVVRIYKPQVPNYITIDFLNKGLMYKSCSPSQTLVVNTMLKAKAGDIIDVVARSNVSKIRRITAYWKSDGNVQELPFTPSKTNPLEVNAKAVVVAGSNIKDDCLFVTVFCEDGISFKAEFNFERSDVKNGDILIETNYNGELYSSWSDRHGCSQRVIEARVGDIINYNITAIDSSLKAAYYRYGNGEETSIPLASATKTNYFLMVSDSLANLTYDLEITAITQDGVKVTMVQPIKVIKTNHMIDIIVGKKLNDKVTTTQGSITPSAVIEGTGTTIAHTETAGAAFIKRNVVVNDDYVIYLRGMSTIRASSIGLDYSLSNSFMGGSAAYPISNSNGNFAVALDIAKYSANWENGEHRISVSYNINGKKVLSTEATFIYEKKTPTEAIVSQAGVVEELTATNGKTIPAEFKLKVNGNSYIVAEESMSFYNNLNKGDVVLYQLINNRIVIKDIVRFREIKNFKTAKVISNKFIQIDGFDYSGQNRGVVSIEVNYNLGPEVPFKEDGLMGVRQEGSVTFKSAKYLGQEAKGVEYLNNNFGDIRGFVTANDNVYLMVLPLSYRPIHLDEEGHFSLGHVQPYVEEPVVVLPEPPIKEETEVVSSPSGEPDNPEINSTAIKTPSSIITKVNGNNLSNGTNIGTAGNGKTVVGEMERNSIITINITDLDARISKVKVIDSMAAVEYSLSEFPVVYAVNDIFNEDGPFELYMEYIDKDGKTLLNEDGTKIRDKIVSFTYTK